MILPTRCYIFDLDGTLADCGHRLHHIKSTPKNYRAFFAACKEDGPIPHMVELALHLQKIEKLVFVSGRSDEVREETSAWLKGHNLTGPLYMKRSSDNRPDYIAKSELPDQIIADGFAPIMAFEDRDQVVKMWR